MLNLSLHPARAALASLALVFAAAVVAAAQAQSPAHVQDSSRLVARVRATLRAHTGDIVEISFSPDGATLATGAEDGTVRLWDARTGEGRATLRLTKELDEVSIRWSPDGRLLLTDWFKELGSRRGHAQVWDARTGELRAALVGHRWDINTYEWSPDSSRILTASEDGTARVWDASTGRSLAEIVFEQINADSYTDSLLKATFTSKKLPEFVSIQARYVAGGRNILVGSTAKPPALYTSDGKLIATLDIPIPPAPTLYRTSYVYYAPPVVSPDSQLVVTHDREGARVWDAATGARRYTLTGAGADIYFSPDSRQLLTSWRDDPSKWLDTETAPLKLWNAGTGKLIRSIDTLPAPYLIFWSPQGERIVTIGYAKAKSRVIDLREGRVVARLPWEGCDPESFFGEGGCDPFTFNADGSITVKLKGELHLFSAETGALFAALPDTHRRAAFNPTDARLLAARSKDKKLIYLYELELNQTTLH
ncbi:MAG: hypothetical protein QOF61_3150 [Acidobacteriota bacterium]|nr:hypothetical protein [Acidobacteriota bacterium]